MITIKQIIEISNKIINESLEMSNSTRLTDKELSVMVAFKKRLIEKLYDREAAEPLRAGDGAKRSHNAKHVRC